MTTRLARCFCVGRGWSFAEHVHRLENRRDRRGACAGPQTPAFPDDTLESRCVASSTPRCLGETSGGTPSNVDVVEVPSVNAALAH